MLTNLLLSPLHNQRVMTTPKQVGLRRAILQDSPTQFEEGGSSSENGENSGSQTDTAAGNQSADASGDSAESKSSSQANTGTSPRVTTTEDETGVREETINREYEEEIAVDDTMVMYVNAQEPNPALRPQLIACYRSMWTVNRSKEFFYYGIVNKTGGFKNRAIMPETRVVVADVKAFSDIYQIFQLHQFDWMDNVPGEYSSHLTREFYSSYASTLMNFVADTVTTMRGQNDMDSTWGPLNSIIVRGKSIDIFEASINRILHGPEYFAPISVTLFEGKHHEVTSDATVEDQTSRERVLRWIPKKIARDGENAGWVTTTPTLITKASLSFPAKVWWAVVRAQLRSTGNYNTLSPSLASLVASLMVGYPVNAGRIIAIEMRDRALNERVALPLTQVSKFKDVANHIFGAKCAIMDTLAVIPHVPLYIPRQVEIQNRENHHNRPQRSALNQDTGRSDCALNAQLIETKVLVAKKEIKDEMKMKLSVLKDRMDGLENLVQDRFQTTGLVDTEEFRD
ncbi:hypothetical protein KY284_010526 [Solanum tuberosum]|nr:hypothetical protein KY284_010526 [Solanum tuberosum]